MSTRLGKCYDSRVETCFASCRDIQGEYRCKALTSGYRDKLCPFYKDKKGGKGNEIITH